MGNLFNKTRDWEGVTMFIMCLCSVVCLIPISIFMKTEFLHLSIMKQIFMTKIFCILKLFCLILFRTEVCMSFVWLFKLYLPNRRSMLGFRYANQWERTGDQVLCLSPRTERSSLLSQFQQRYQNWVLLHGFLQQHNTAPSHRWGAYLSSFQMLLGNCTHGRDQPVLCFFKSDLFYNSLFLSLSVFFFFPLDW